MYVKSGKETELFLPDEFYNKNLPSQVTPGTKYLPKYDEVGNVISTVKVSAGYYIECVDLGKTIATRIPVGTSRIEFKIYTTQGTVRLLGMSYFDKAE